MNISDKASENVEVNTDIKIDYVNKDERDERKKNIVNGSKILPVAETENRKDAITPDDLDQNVSLVNATVAIQNSKSCLLDRNDVSAVRQIIKSKDHLRQRIAEIEYGYAKSSNTQNSLFMHGIPVVLRLRTNYLGKKLYFEATRNQYLEP